MGGREELSGGRRAGERTALGRNWGWDVAASKTPSPGHVA